MNALRDRWRQFASRPFPDGIAGSPVNGIELAELDSFVAGHITAYLGGVELDPDSRRRLAACVQELGQALPHLSGKSHGYFAELIDLTREVLESSRAG